MSNRFFLKWMTVTTGIFVMGIFLLGNMSFFQPIKDFSWYSLIFFVLTTVLVYSLSYLGIKGSSTTGFIYYVLGSMALKFLLCFVAVVLYYYYLLPTTMYFVAPFLVMYIAFTVVETYSLVKLSRTMNYKKTED